MFIRLCVKMLLSFERNVDIKLVIFLTFFSYLQFMSESENERSMIIAEVRSVEDLMDKFTLKTEMLSRERTT